MATEILAQRFYRHDDFVQGYYSLYIALERWIAANIFRKDISRVFLASNEYAFRRRFELTDTSKAYDTIGASSLQFPFANYWPNNAGWQPDNRPAANTASQVIIGLPHQTRMLRAIAVTTTIAITFYFDREDDARLAYETLLWLSYREQFMYTTIAWKGEQLGIPLNVKIQNLAFNPDFKENTWLETNRIFTIVAELELRSFSLQPPKQPIYTSNVPVEDDERFTLTEEVILKLKNDKKIIGEVTIDSLYNQNPKILINQFGVASTTPTTARITWDVAVEAPEQLSSIQISLSGREPVVLDKTKIDYTFRKLTENSTYIVTIKFFTENGLSKVASLQFTTPLSELGAQEKVAPSNNLVGITW